MKIRLLHLWDELQSSLWFIPGFMTLTAVLLASLILEADARFPLEESGAASLLYTGGPQGAANVLSVIAGSMINVAGVVFSVTIVALSLASTQFGPRLLRTFMRDPANKLVLGTFIATFVFSLLGLRAVNPSAGPEAVPELTVTVAILLALASLAMLIYFIHHISSSIRAEVVISDVARELNESIDHLYPQAMGWGDLPGTEESIWEAPMHFGEEARGVRTPETGYLQAIDEEGLMNLASEQDLLLWVHFQPGRFIPEGDHLVSVWPADRLTEELARDIVGLFIIGSKRTAEQDVEFSINQLVEVASRSLSPGINDPFTAIVCVDRLGSALCRLCGRRFPLPFREDEAGHVRVIAERENFEGLVHAAFNPLRQYARPSVQVTIRLLETLATLAWCIGPVEGYRRVLQAHADKILHGAESYGHEPSDLEDIRQRYERVNQALHPEAPMEASGAPGGPS